MQAHQVAAWLNTGFRVLRLACSWGSGLFFSYIKVAGLIAIPCEVRSRGGHIHLSVWVCKTDTTASLQLSDVLNSGNTLPGGCWPVSLEASFSLTDLGFHLLIPMCWEEGARREGAALLSLAQNIGWLWIGTVQSGFSTENKTLFLFYPLRRQKLLLLWELTYINSHPPLQPPQAKQLDREAEQGSPLKILPKDTDPSPPALTGHLTRCTLTAKGPALPGVIFNSLITVFCLCPSSLSDACFPLLLRLYRIYNFLYPFVLYSQTLRLCVDAAA